MIVEPASSAVADLDRIPAGVLTLGADLRVLQANEGMAGLLGVKSVDLDGRSLDDLLAPASRVMLHSYLLPLLHLHGHVEEFAATLNAAAGLRPDVLLYARWDGGPANADRCLHVVAVRHRARRQVEDDLLRIKRAADLSPGVLFQLLLSADGKVQLPYASEALRAHFQVSPQEARRNGRRVIARVHPQDRRLLAAQMAAAAKATTAEVHQSIRVRSGPGQWRTHEVQASGRATEDGGWIWQGHTMDITARLQLEATLRERDAAEAARRRQLEFLTRLSHELRTPLNGILGFTQLLDRQTDPPLAPEHRAAVSVIGEAGRHLLRLIDDVLEISRQQTTDFTVHRQPVDLAPVMQAAIRAAQPAAELRSISLRIDPNRGQDSNSRPDDGTGVWPPVVLADALRLRQVMDNLIGNAVKFSRMGGRVELTASCSADEVSVTVTDDGPGIAPADQLRLFQPFNRLGAEHSGVPGTGLGLVICKQLVEAMEGRIEVRSAPGQGARFTVHLQRAAAALDVADPAAPGDRREATAAPTRPPGAPADILYVEDDKVNALLMTELLELRSDLRLRVATSTESALRAVEEQPPQLLLLDRHLPDGDGLELRRRLLALPGMQNVPTIMVSAAATDHDIALARAAGFDGYWTKPLDVQTVLADLDRRIPPSPDPAGR